ncbi:hypothetical protein AVENP_1634 [Arcobacter venerupis]|uniref:Uncharacterized protein n=1 Tax=Arcobacter venerupis TaxID=1054033 RepID=A0AAE7E3T0_9BACT|nr:hypothetical protein [Arcobacter venerupis]QKF67180.1 hypothetical protein AVENP_1634 [Arcobacter venerupis]RWS48392.1 hypothetical protein CKA56_14215 [Arcobacter venerupis]
MKKIKLNTEDTVRVKISPDVFKIVLVTQVNQTTFNSVDVNEKEEVFFLHDIVKVITTQKKLDLKFENKIVITQPTLF